MTDTSPYEGWETLVPDERLEIAVAKVRSEILDASWMDRMDFMTAVDPATTMRREGTIEVPDHLFQVIAVADDPSPDKARLVRKGKMSPVKTAMIATGWLSGWRESEKEREHYVAVEDPLVGFLRWLVVALSDKLENLANIGQRA